VEILFVTGFSPIVADPPASRAFYSEALNLPLDHEEGAYVFTESLSGVKHFGLWPLSQAAQSCFGSDEWPSDLAVPQATIEFEVRDVASAAAELEAKGCKLIHSAKTEPWGQTIARLLSPEGLLVGVSYVPALRDAGESHSAS
jgi:catechol 2,3-dioxygenase-like lactoylglutathione lyase family enzyme